MRKGTPRGAKQKARSEDGRSDPLRLLKAVCALPTAPFVEDRVGQFVERFVAERPQLRLRRDEAGNLLVELPGQQPRRPRWVFAAHMDHPGFVARRMRTGRGRRGATLEAEFRGYVLGAYLRGAAVRFFDGEREIVGTVETVKSEKAGRAKSALVRVAEAVSPGSAGMPDVGEGHVVGRRFFCRVCDDLAGAAAALAMLEALRLRPPAATVAVLLTRAEEEGFIGAVAACLRPRLLKKSDRMVAIECSAEQPVARQGEGPIIRVGDRTSIFNSALSYFLARQAEALSRRQKEFKHQRALMPGGTCEATVYDLYGYAAASVCVALGNYHNMDRKRGRLAAEHVDVNDWQNMVRFFVHLARQGHEYAPGHRALRTRVEERYQQWEATLLAARGSVAGTS